MKIIKIFSEIDTEERLYSVSLNENEYKLYSWFFNSKSSQYNKLGTPKERFQFIKENYPESVSPIHMNFLELEKKINNKDLLKVTYDGMINIGSDLINLAWDPEAKVWYDDYDECWKPLKDYIIHKVDKYNDDVPGFDKLIGEIKKSSWIK